MKDDLIIEPIKSSNFNEFLYLIDELAKYEKLKQPDDKAKIRLKKDGLSKNPKYEAYLAKKDDKYLGYAIFFMSYSSFIAKPILYLEDIFVLQKYRKKGIGQLLFNLVVSIAKKRDCCRIEWHVPDWNQLGIKFYDKNNAKQLSNWLFYRLSSDRFDDFL